MVFLMPRVDDIFFISFIYIYIKEYIYIYIRNIYTNSEPSKMCFKRIFAGGTAHMRKFQWR